MIYLLSQKEDITTHGVIDWLLSYGQPFIRINKDDKFGLLDLFNRLSNKGIKLDASNHLNFNGEKLIFWFRRPGGNVVDILGYRPFPVETIEFPKFKTDSRMLESLKNNYAMYLRTYFHLHLDNEKSSIGSYFKTSLNKLEVLSAAQEIGINIPPSIVTNDIELLEKFYNENDKNIICKTLYEIIHPVGSLEEGFSIRCLTDKVTDLDDLPQEFFPTLFQKNIQKKYELRTFYLRGKCFTAAIFSQNSAKTIIDFRNRDIDSPNRIVPYKLDDELELKITELMQAVGLNSGSIDFIKGIDNKYYFLEINPVGQFGFMSSPCNYKLEKIIANELIQMHEAI